MKVGFDYTNDGVNNIVLVRLLSLRNRRQLLAPWLISPVSGLKFTQVSDKSISNINFAMLNNVDSEGFLAGLITPVITQTAASRSLSTVNADAYDLNVDAKCA